MRLARGYFYRKANNYFGFPKDQLTIVQQGLGVPALENNHAKIAIDSHSQDNPYKVQAKPHGHGDVHALVYSEGVAKDWLAKGIEWTVFFQDTNGLAFHTLPLALGLSKKMGLIMNSLAVPRKAKQAIGGIAQLTNINTKGDSANGEQRTINVEYNQLDPLLRSSKMFANGDENDTTTGYSPFPGNINQLVFQLQPYSEALDRTQGAMPEFVNPKYKDTAKSVFKKPTRLECMMQDFPTILKGIHAQKVGFTCIDSEVCFSPVKNATTDGIALQSKGINPGVAATGEQDQYQAQAIILRKMGVQVAEPAGDLTFCNIKVHLTPAIVLKPNFVSCPAEYKIKFPNPSQVKISSRSSLVVEGEGIVIQSLDLDGALIIRAEPGANVNMNMNMNMNMNINAACVIDNLVVKNKGWVNVSDSSSDNEVIQMRGYRLSKLETKTIVFKADGTIEGGYELPSSASASSYNKNKNTNTNGTVSKDEVVVTKKTNGSSSRALPITSCVNTEKELPADLNAPDDADTAGEDKCQCACAIM
jgi:UDP-sugar pyrophosphorylase